MRKLSNFELMCWTLFLAFVLGAFLVPNLITKGTYNDRNGMTIFNGPSQEILSLYWNEIFKIDIADDAEFLECNPQLLKSVFPQVPVFHLKVRLKTEQEKERMYQSIMDSGWKESSDPGVYTKKVKGASLLMNVKDEGRDVELNMETAG